MNDGNDSACILINLTQIRNCYIIFSHVATFSIKSVLLSATCAFFAGAVEVRKEGLEAQINRLAELIGRLENKVKTANIKFLLAF